MFFNTFVLMKRCPECSGIAESQDAGLTCLSCGKIIKESYELQSTLVSDPNSNTPMAYEGTFVSPYKAKTNFIATDRTNPSTFVKNKIEIKKKKLFDTVDSLVSKIPISTSYSDVIKNKALAVMGDAIMGGKKGELTVAAIIFCICREHSRPLTILDVSDILQCDVYKLARSVRKLKHSSDIQPMKTTSYIERTLSELLKNQLEDSKRYDLTKKARKLFEVAEANSLVTGRKPGSLIGAVLSIILESLPNYANLATTMHIAKVVCVTENTIKKRRKEIFNLLFSYAKRLPWWGADFKPTDVIKHLKMIMEYIDFLDGFSNKRCTPQKGLPRVSSSTPKRCASEANLDVAPNAPKENNPPSFNNANDLRKDMEIKIKRAKHRLNNLYNSINSKTRRDLLMSFKTFDVSECCNNEICIHPADKEDLNIQNLLLGGEDESKILQGFTSDFQTTPQKIQKLKECNFNVDMYIRTDDEIDRLKQIVSPQCK